MNRREFLKQNARSALILTAGVFGLTIPGINGLLAAGIPDIGVVKGPRKSATRAAVELIGGIKSVVKPGDRVLIKPNMSFASSPRQATNTSPEVIREVVAMCKEAGAGKIMVLDHTLGPAEACISRSGIRDAVNGIESNLVHSVNADNLYKEMIIPNAKVTKRMQFLKEALRCDTLIAVPTAKSHSSTGVSLSMKGMMGLIWDRGSMHWQNLNVGIVDICTILKADLTVIDGSRVLSTNGPRGPGKVLTENTIIASRDMVAADAYAVSAFVWYGKKFKPRQVGHILEAHQRGFGRMDLENLNIKRISL